jgi:hypothetical protein
MSSNMITQPATTGAPLPTRPLRLLAFGKLLGLVIAIGTAAALAIAAGIGIAALLVTSATS